MGSSPKTPEPTKQERALASDSAHKWNDYVERYIPMENELVKRSQATDDKVAGARNMANADASMAYGEAQQQANAGLASQGAAPGSGRSAMAASSLGDAYGAATGQSQGIAAQGVHDREQAMRVKMSAFGRDLQDNTQLSLASAGNRATDATIKNFGRKVDARNSAIRTAVSLAGAGMGAPQQQGLKATGGHWDGTMAPQHFR